MSYTPAWICHFFARSPPRRDARPAAMSHLAFAAAPVALRSVPCARRAGRPAPVVVRAVSTAPSSDPPRSRPPSPTSRRRRCVSQRAPRPRPSLSLHSAEPSRLVIRAPPGTPTASPRAARPRARARTPTAAFRPIQPSRERQPDRPPLPRAVRHPRRSSTPRHHPQKYHSRSPAPDPTPTPAP